MAELTSLLAIGVLLLAVNLRSAYVDHGRVVRALSHDEDETPGASTSSKDVVRAPVLDAID